ncbi:uncharacterized protein LOC123548074 [Mercenaria mercenaria]|uniref:uncharacterized protein LOC123548074 n=1 Tax=Mercenaria mercenaria TaxID=6596 RepID=UPI00234E6E08|nr:uncharacterized protein LOC123548074 [Mercenaria mercenaria]
MFKRGSVQNARRKIILTIILTAGLTVLFVLVIKNYSNLAIFEKEKHSLDSHFVSRQVQGNHAFRKSLFLHEKRNVSRSPRKTYIVNTPYCKIPNFHPFHPRIKKFVQILEPARCKWNAPLVYQSGYYLTVNLRAAKLPPYSNNVKFCTYKPIYRPAILPTHKNFIWYGEESAPFNISTKVPYEFVRVNCYDKQNNCLYFNFHAFVQNNVHLYNMFKRRLEMHLKEKVLKKYMNVMLVGIDSLSRLSFMRQMVKTRAFLKENLSAFDMMGYNKVGDNTFVNIVPLTLGKFFEEIPWNRNKTFDEFKFIWKQFEEKGYRTLFAEDRPDISAFDFMKKGFSTPPCEHYYRPMSIAMFNEEGHWTKNHTCFQDRLEVEIILNYTYDFVDTYRNNAQFSFTFLSGVTHDNQNGASEIDDIYYNFFKRLHCNDLIQNTVIFFFSDHGIRYGSVRETFIGKLEERLPLMYLIVPEWLRKSYLSLSSALYINQNRLASPFDVYKTLKDILFFDGLTKPTNESSRGVTWFREIPYTSSCESAGIAPHWCTCLQHKKVKVNNPEVVNASNVVLKEINKLLFQYESLCEELSIYEIKDAIHIYGSDSIIMGSKGNIYDITLEHDLKNKRKESTEYVQVTIETIPGHAQFEATVQVELLKKHNVMHYRLSGDISRINMYMKQSSCVEDFHLKKFCFCK